MTDLLKAVEALLTAVKYAGESNLPGSAGRGYVARIPEQFVVDVENAIRHHEAVRESLPTVAGDELTIADYEAAFADHRRLVRELDVALNGEDAAEQASLCDIVQQVKREGRPTVGGGDDAQPCGKCGGNGWFVGSGMDSRGEEVEEQHQCDDCGSTGYQFVRTPSPLPTGDATERVARAMASVTSNEKWEDNPAREYFTELAQAAIAAMPPLPIRGEVDDLLEELIQRCYEDSIRISCGTPKGNPIDPDPMVPKLRDQIGKMVSSPPIETSQLPAALEVAVETGVMVDRCRELEEALREILNSDIAMREEDEGRVSPELERARQALGDKPQQDAGGQNG